MSKPNLESIQEQDVQSLFGNLWELTKVEAIAASSRNALVGGPFGSNLVSKDYTESGVPVIRGQNMALGRWVSGEFAYVSEEKARQLASNTARPGDLIFTQRGTLGQVAVVPEGQFDKYIISQSQMKLTPDIEKCDVMFLYYFFSSPAMQTYMLTNSIQVGVPHTNLSILKGAPVVVPPLPIQREIAHILGSLDDKIDLNRRMNATLESMARALFKSWFVDFDPVRAKSEGRQPDGIDADTAALFPDSFEDSALGPIPAGWRIGRFDELVVLQRGFDLPTSQRTPGKYPILAASGPSGTHHEYRVKGPGVTTGRSGVLGQVFFVHENYWPLNTSLWVKEFRASRPHHAFHLLSTIDFAQLNAGSAVPTLNRNHVHDMRVVVPDPAVIEAFEAFVAPMFQLKKQKEEEAANLAATRDALLPRLMSGTPLSIEGNNVDF